MKDAVLFDNVVHAVVLIAEIATAGKRAETYDIGTSLPPTRNHVFINAIQNPHIKPFQEDNLNDVPSLFQVGSSFKIKRQ